MSESKRAVFVSYASEDATAAQRITACSAVIRGKKDKDEKKAKKSKEGKD